MNTATELPLTPSLRDRLAFVLSSLDFAPLYPHTADSCAECRQARADVDTLNDGTAVAILAVHEAPTEAAAMAAYFDHFAALAGLDADVDAEAAGGAL